jgi:hypothetical protein
VDADSKTPNLTAQAEAARADRLAREAKALRENLRRRKAQGRAREQDSADQPTPPAAQG